MCIDLVTSLDNLFQYSTHHHSENNNNKKLFFRYNLCFTLCLSPLVLSLYTMEKNLSSFYQAFMHMNKVTPISRLDSPSPLSLSPRKKCSKPITIFLVLCWSCSSSPGMICTEELRTGHHSRCASSVLSRREGPPPLTCWRCFSRVLFSLPQGHTAGLCSTWCPLGTHGSFSAKLQPLSPWPVLVAWSYSCLRTEIGISLCRTSWDSHWPISPSCLGPFELQQNHLG